MANFIAFLVLVSILGLTISAGFGIYIAGQKGRKFTLGMAFGFVPIIGHLILALVPSTTSSLKKELHERKAD